MVKKDTPRAQLKPINDEFEPRPFRWPKCYCRCKNKGGLVHHYNTHKLGPLSVDVRPSAREGYEIDPDLLKIKKKIDKKVAMDKGRRKGQKAKRRIRNLDDMKKGVALYEEALANGESSSDYQKRTGVGKSKIHHWRTRIAEKANEE